MCLLCFSAMRLLVMICLLLNCLPAVNCIKVLNPGKIRSLHFSNMVEQFPNDFNPTDFIGILKCSQRAGHLECLMACSRDQRCASVNYIPEANICLLHWSHDQVRLIENPERDFFTTTLYTVYLDGRRSYKYSSTIGHGKPPHKCGSTSLNLLPSLVRDKRIIKGYTPLPYNMPWMGILTRDSKLICSAILLSKKARNRNSGWAMVASHCIFTESDDQMDEEGVDYSRFGFLFGVHDLRLATPHIRYRKVQRVYRNFEPSDLSLVKLSRSVRFDSYINGLCLPDEPHERAPSEFSMCLTCGWGATKPSTSAITPKASNELQCIKVEVEEEKPTELRRRSILTIQWHDRSLIGPYKGDSGSPLFCRLIYDPKKFLYGVVTSGASVTLSGLTHFERIPSSLEWINQIMDRDVPNPEDGYEKRICCFSFKFSNSAGQRHSLDLL